MLAAATGLKPFSYYTTKHHHTRGTKDDENAWDGAKWAALRSAQLLWLKAGDVMLMPSSVVHLVITLKTKLVVAGDILTAANFERAVWADDTFRRTAKTKVPSEMGKRLDEGAEWLLTRLGAAQVPLALRGRAVERMLGLLAADSEAESRRPKAERRTDQKSIEKRAMMTPLGVVSHHSIGERKTEVSCC